MARAIRMTATMVFVFISNLQLLSSVERFLNQPFTTGNEVDQYHDNGNHQQDVNEPAHRVTAYETEQPQNEQDCRNCVQHIFFFQFAVKPPPAGAFAPVSDDSSVYAALANSGSFSTTLTPLMGLVTALRIVSTAVDPTSPAAFRAPSAAAAAASSALTPNSLAPSIAPATSPVAAAPTSPPTSAVSRIATWAVWLIVSKTAVPVCLVPRSTPSMIPLAACPRSAPTCTAPRIAPLATLATTSVTDVPTLPVSLMVVARICVTASTVAWTMFPVPLMAATIWSFTVSIIPECVVFMPCILSSGYCNLSPTWAGWRAFAPATSHTPV